MISASHVIEHTIDLIAFLNDCSMLLKDEGRIKLMIPDKRYEFDYFRSTTSIRNVIDEHMNSLESNVHSIGTMVESLLFTVTIKECSTFIPNSALYYQEDMFFEWERDGIKGI